MRKVSYGLRIRGALCLALMVGCGGQRRVNHEVVTVPDSGVHDAVEDVPERDPRGGSDGGGADLDVGLADGGSTGLDTGGVDVGLRPGRSALTGTFGARLVVAQIAGTGQNATPRTTTMLIRMVNAQINNQFSYEGKICDIQINAGSGVSVTLPRAAVDAFPALTGTGTVSTNGAMSAPAIVRLVGWTSNTPEADALPSSTNDSRVRDADNDGNQGVTVQITSPISTFALMVYRTKLDFRGAPLDENRLQGLTKSTLEQSIIGAGNANVPRGPLNLRPNPDPSLSTFKMVRLGTTGNACADIVARAATLF